MNKLIFILLFLLLIPLIQGAFISDFLPNNELGIYKEMNRSYRIAIPNDGQTNISAKINIGSQPMFHFRDYPEADEMVFIIQPGEKQEIFLLAISSKNDTIGMRKEISYSVEVGELNPSGFAPQSVRNVKRITIVILSRNNPLLTSINNLKTKINKLFTYQVICSDVDNDTLIYSVDSFVNNKSYIINISNMGLINHTFKEAGKYTTTIKCSDGLTTNSTSFIISVTGFNFKYILYIIPTIIIIILSYLLVDWIKKKLKMRKQSKKINSSDDNIYINLTDNDQKPPF